MPYATPEARRDGRRASYVRRKDKILAQERGYRSASPERFRDVRYKHRYGLTLVQVNAMIEAQNGCCAICCEPFKPAKKKLAIHVDHCHDTMKVRGILCARCNVGLGLFEDDADRLMQAIRYLEK